MRLGKGKGMICDSWRFWARDPFINHLTVTDGQKETTQFGHARIESIESYQVHRIWRLGSSWAAAQSTRKQATHCMQSTGPATSSNVHPP